MCLHVAANGYMKITQSKQYLNLNIDQCLVKFRVSGLGRNGREKLDKMEESIGINGQHNEGTTVYNYCFIHEDQSEKSSKTLSKKIQ